MTLKYKLVAKDIAQKIDDHVYTDKLPSEQELINHYQVSRNTIRNALNLLYNQGMVRSIQGSGYFVNTSAQPGELIVNGGSKKGLYDLEKADPISSKVLSLEVIPADQEIATRLQCPLATDIYHVKRLRSNSKEVVSLEDAYYLKSVVPYLTEEVCRESIFNFITKTYGVEIKNGDEFIKLARLTKVEADLTGLEVATPALHLTEVNYLKNEQPFNYSKTLYLQSDLTLYYHVSNYLN